MLCLEFKCYVQNSNALVCFGIQTLCSDFRCSVWNLDVLLRIQNLWSKFEHCSDLQFSAQNLNILLWQSIITVHYPNLQIRMLCMKSKCSALNFKCSAHNLTALLRIWKLLFGIPTLCSEFRCFAQNLNLLLWHGITVHYPNLQFWMLCSELKCSP